MSWGESASLGRCVEGLRGTDWLMHACCCCSYCTLSVMRFRDRSGALLLHNYTKDMKLDITKSSTLSSVHHWKEDRLREWILHTYHSHLNWVYVRWEDVRTAWIARNIHRHICSSWVTWSFQIWWPPSRPGPLHWPPFRVVRGCSCAGNQKQRWERANERILELML